MCKFSVLSWLLLSMSQVSVCRGRRQESGKAASHDNFIRTPDPERRGASLQAPDLAAIITVKDSFGTTEAQQPFSQERAERLVPLHGFDFPRGRVLTTPVVKAITSAVASGTLQILPSLSNLKPYTTSTIPSELVTWSRASEQPILTKSISSPTSLLSPTASVSKTLLATPTAMASADIFADPVDMISPPANISKRKDHPVPRIGISDPPPISTNKFYANFFLGSQKAPAYLHPYAVSWAGGKGPSASWGLAISHTEQHQRVYGPRNAATGAASYFINPVGIQSIVVSARDLGSDTKLATDQLTAFSCRVSLRSSAAAPPSVQFPLVQGSVFVTAVFSGAMPLIQTGVFLKNVTRITKEPKAWVTKYKFLLEDGHCWLVYAHRTKGDPLSFHVVNNGLAQAKSAFYGILQVAKDPGNGEALYDQACAVYPTDVTLFGSVQGTTGRYTLSFVKGGMTDSTLAMFALPHHQASFDSTTRSRMSAVKMQTTTKGMSVAVVSDSWTMMEPGLPTSMSFVPWTAKTGGLATLSANTKQFIHNIARQEVSQNMDQQSDQNSMYFSGKALAKFAQVLITINDMLGDNALAQTGLAKLKQAFSRFADNRQQFPLVYEYGWGGVVSSATYVSGDPGADFGNTYYNDHHFHYGYFILTAAVIGHLDPSWIKTNKDYVNTLVRDIANPSTQDKFFPVWRCFDWYHGHSWAHGLFETLDGKDQESSSEDTMHAYALKMWGLVAGDQNLEARGNLMLAVQARAMASYYLYSSTNVIEPPQFIGNKVAGILFENKIDHTTYFGSNIEYIQGIHMLPLLPHTPLIRNPSFVAEEWNSFFNQGRADKVAGGWKGILYGNYATIDPKGAYAFFANPKFDPGWLDGGASLTWYLAYAAALGGL